MPMMLVIDGLYKPSTLFAYPERQSLSIQREIGRVVINAYEVRLDVRPRGRHRQEHAFQLLKLCSRCGELELNLG
jgi:hypothetical protein